MKHAMAYVSPVDAPIAAELPSWWRQLITGPDNVQIEPSMLAAMFGVFILLPFVIILLCGLAYLDVVVNKHDAAVGALGGGVGAVIAAMGAYIVSLVLMLRQDRAPLPPGTTTSSSSSTTKTTNP